MLCDQPGQHPFRDSIVWKLPQDFPVLTSSLDKVSIFKGFRRSPGHLAQPFVLWSYFDFRILTVCHPQQFVDHQLLHATLALSAPQRPCEDIGRHGIEYAVADADRNPTRGQKAERDDLGCVEIL